MQGGTTVVLVVGMPGAGKSTLCKHLCAALPRAQVAGGDARVVVEVISFDACYPPHMYINEGDDRECAAPEETSSFDAAAYTRCQEAFRALFKDRVKSACENQENQTHQIILVEDVLAHASARRHYFAVVEALVETGAQVQCVVLHCLPSAFIGSGKPQGVASSAADDRTDFAIAMERNAGRAGSERVPAEVIQSTVRDFAYPRKRWERAAWLSVRPRRFDGTASAVKPKNDVSRVQVALMSVLSEDYVVRHFTKGERFHRLHS